MNMVIFTFSMSLFDSLSPPFEIFIFILLLTTLKPVRNSLIYLAGLSGTYFLSGMAGYMALDQLRVLLNKFLSAADAAVPNPLYYLCEFLLGAGVVVLGILYFYRNKDRDVSEKENKFLLKLRAINGWFAFGMGVFVSIVSLSVPYLLAVIKYSELNLGFLPATGFILLYNLSYASPMFLILLLYLFARRDAGVDHDALHEKAKMLNLHLTAWTLVGFGLFSILDAGCYFALGHALLKERYF